MKRVRTISLSLIPTLLLPLMACEESDRMYCTDDAGIVIDPSKCEADDIVEADAGTKQRAHFWYYSGSSGRTTIIQQGSRVSGGSYTPSPSRNYSSPHNPSITFRPSSGFSTPGSYRSSPSVRGGFGGTGRSFGGGARGGSVGGS